MKRLFTQKNANNNKHMKGIVTQMTKNASQIIKYYFIFILENITFLIKHSVRNSVETNILT